MANKISGIDGRSGTGRCGAPLPARVTPSGRQESRDHRWCLNIDVSDTARTLAALESHIGTLPVVNESRVDAVRRAVDDGRYHVDPQRVADKMLRFEVDLLATIPAHK